VVNRRKSLTAAGRALAIGSLLERRRFVNAMPRAATELGRVKILDVKTASVRLTYYDAHLVKITTDSGLYGLGEAFNRAGVVDHINMLCHNMCSPLGTIAVGHACMAIRSFNYKS